MLRIEDIERIALDFVKKEEPFYEDEFATAGDAGIIREWASVTSVGTQGSYWVAIVERGHSCIISEDHFDKEPIQRILFWKILIDEFGKVVEYQKIPASEKTRRWKK